jgi:cob(I)alamin adenosyltransferase
VLDEITHAIDDGWVDEKHVVATLARRQPWTSVILTGRHASRRLRTAADTITRFDLVKHRGKRGILA